VTLAELNDLDFISARDELLECCGSRRWAEAMASLRPFESVQAIIVAAHQTWCSLQESDWLQAFAAHPRIGERGIGAQRKGWSAEEQRGMEAARSETALQMSRLNEAYYQRFGWTFIICATGKAAEEMRAALEQRLASDAETELRIAAGEQEKITELRIQKLLSQ
jgi:OHCU decarboxylase